MLDKINTLVFYKILFFLTGYISLTITNLFYMSTISPDFDRYKLYLYYFFGGQTDLSFFFHFTFLRRIFAHFGLLKVFSFMFRRTKEGLSSRTEDRLFGDSCNLKEIKEF